MPEVIATESRMARTFKMSERSIREKFKEVRIAPGQYDFIAAVEMFVESSSGKDESLELKRVEKETKELKLGIMREEYHHKDDITLLVSDMLLRMKSKLNGIPLEASLLLLNKSDRREIEDILRKKINIALLELSEYKDLKMEDVEIGEEND
ncbi:hypothetical protein C4N20_15730 [Fusobacterium ulcerans]|uniref:Phage portal protein n=1 Tax=Fusobacterium ulcerans TaxID=861 RepID=A0AAX2JAP7_9FUSO|nr:hypothetical protein [Fusobacterium ulcerans]AVQ29482.1 hypothetical protein C4N20_15730 [Fusobacterium ulcerans]EFS27019.1 hypothetical protein FUAG_02534 [Fusobacterium ulcerans ATCC 49185]SQJ03963.1 Uncharacterised protein [Fusobacterium ulcerans]